MDQRGELAWRDRVAVREGPLEQVSVDSVGDGLADQMVFDLVGVETSIVLQIRDLPAEQGGLARPGRSGGDQRRATLPWWHGCRVEVPVDDGLAEHPSADRDGIQPGGVAW